ncbi:MAG: Holliday junction branch migration protein RuvA [Lachnospiraceae bacterium]|nr:Holliday junction branch migration protein RuvA [Lachnospiraceae bacterium]
MIAFLDGKVEYINESTLWFDVNGTGYELNMPKSDLENMVVGDRLRIYTYLSVREDAMELFGFIGMEALNMFKKLIKVSGVGPKIAIGILSFLPPSELSMAILSNDVKLIAKSPGIGPKTAGKIVLELKDKIDFAEGIENIMPESDENVDKAMVLSVKNDVIEALTELGFSAVDARRAVRNIEINENTTVDRALSEALKELS